MSPELSAVLARVDRSVSIVRGCHKVTKPSKLVRREGLRHRVAFVLGSFRRDRADLFFDAELFFDLAAGAARLLAASRVEVVPAECREPQDLDAARESTLAEPEVDRAPPTRILFKDDRETLLGVVESEYWAQLGGPDPYSDSYTLSLYPREEKFEGLVLMCDATCQRLNATLAAVYEGDA